MSGLLEQVPLYSVNYLDDGDDQKLSLVVQLPGVESASDIRIEVKPRMIHVHVPGLYMLSLPLGSEVLAQPEIISFSKAKAVLKAQFITVPVDRGHRGASAAAAAAAADTAASSGPQISASSSEQPVSHDSIFKDILKSNPRMPAHQPSGPGKAACGTGCGAAQGTAAAQADAPPLRSNGTAQKRKEREQDAGSAAGFSSQQYQHGHPQQPEPQRHPAASAPSPAASPAPSTPPPPASSGASPGLNDQYDLGRQQANREAATQFAMRADELLMAQDPNRARKLHLKAAFLWPEEYGHYSVGEELPQSSPSGSRASPAGGADPPASSSRPSPPAAESREGVGRRPSQPYSYMPSPDWGGAGSTSTRPAPASSPERPPSSAAKPDSREPPPQQQQQSAGGSSPSQPTPPPPPPPSGKSSPEAEEVTGDYATRIQRTLDLLFMRLHKQAEAYGRTATLTVWISHLVVSLSITIVALITMVCANTPVFLLSFANQQLAKRLMVAVQTSTIVMVVSATLTAVTVTCLAVWLWTILITPFMFVVRTALKVLSWLVWEPELPMSAAASLAIMFAVDLKKHPLVWKLWLLPITMFFSGTRYWCLTSMPVFLLLYVMSASGAVVSSLATATGFWCVRNLLWYKAMPALLAVIMAWILAVANMPKEDEQPQPGGAQSDGGQDSGADSGSSWWGPASTRKAKLKAEVPKGASGEVARVLRSQDLYEVLNLARDADEEAVRRAKRAMSLATHPDKLGGAEGAKEAFQRVTEAVDVLSDVAKRRDYDRKLKQEEGASRARADPKEEAGGGGGGSGRGAGDDESADAPKSMMDMPCRACGDIHGAFSTDLPLTRARYCARCKTYHQAKNGEAWVDKQGGFWTQKKVFMCLHGMVLDITDYARCNDLLHDSAGNPLEPNTCHVPIRFGTEGKGGGGGGGGGGGSAGSRSRKKGKKR